jgi:hypothetical protein
MILVSMIVSMLKNKGSRGKTFKGRRWTLEKNGDMEELGLALWGDGREGQFKNPRKI